ncbi:helix-turn-helix domain-containing protein [Leeia oryzae]|uniref:helix-turn-helix domain-containing protein n=1 Tax=Leeia oryzae TaxID=356662 RepID=UPI00037A8142|nr:AraC family transcriptional regulator [Leeia oryzae]
MRPLLEHVTIEQGHSWSLLWRELPEIPFIWHYHPEFELTLTLNAQGQRYIGDHLDNFTDQDLVLVGPDQPHTWSASHRFDDTRPMLAIVIWFTTEWLEKLAAILPELRPLYQYFSRAHRGLVFSDAVKAQVVPLMRSLNQLSEPARIPVLLQILIELTKDTAANPLASEAVPTVTDTGGRNRLNRILDLLHAQFQHPPAIAELAQVSALSVGAFHRFFKRHTGCTVLEYIARLRLGHACQLLIQTDKPIALIANQSGYESLAHFNRQFKGIKGMTPSQFRKHYLQHPPC